MADRLALTQERVPLRNASDPPPFFHLAPSTFPLRSRRAETAIWCAGGACIVHAATRVKLAPLAALPEDALVHVARTFEAPGKPVRPGDAVGESLVVLAVEPGPGAALTGGTELEIAPAPRTRDAPKVEIALLVDVSESMGVAWDAENTRLSAAFAAIASFLRSPAASIDAVLLVEYAKHAKVAAGPAKPRELGALPVPKPKGPSHTAEGLDAALALLAARSRPEVSQVVLLFTDGVSQLDALAQAAQRAGRLHVPVHAIVFAPEVDPFFERLAAGSGGSVRQAAHPLTIEFVHEPGA